MNRDRQELDIVRLGAQGDGVADLAGGPVFIARALPGERVVAEVRGDRGRLIEIVRASPERSLPPCPHFGTCGGCVAQHMGATLYRDWKRDMVRTAFAHRGLEPHLDEMIVVPPGTRRRATFSAVKRDGRITLGFHEEGTHTLVDLTVCPVVVPAIAQALPGLHKIADAALAEGGELRMAVTAAIGGLDVALENATDNSGEKSGTFPMDPKARARIARLAADTGVLRVTANSELVVQSVAPKFMIGGVEVLLPIARGGPAFIQATAEAEAAICEILAASTKKARRIADLFSGLGTFTFGLARRARVFAADGDKGSIESLTLSVKAAMGVKPIETRLRDLFGEPLSRQELDGFDAVVFDPPRAGAKAQAEMLAKSKVPVVCAVSCSPATLARDCRILVDGGYSIERVVPVDQFVWSPHIEAVAVLQRKRA